MGKIMWLSDSVFTVTGFATVTKDVLTRLARNKKYDITHIAWNYMGQPLMNPQLLNSDQIPFKVYGGGRLNYAADRLTEYIRKDKPDLFCVLLDTFMLMESNGLQFGWFLGLDLVPAKFLMYFPSDGGGFPFMCENILKKAQYPVAMSKYAQRQVKELFNIDSDYIPHGYRSEIYYRMKNKKELRKKWNLPEDAFVIGAVARNQGRKNMPALITTFAKFAKDKDNAILFLHTDLQDVAAHTDLMALARELKCDSKVRSTGMKFFAGMTVDEMREIYNCMDVHALTTTGEGFGVPTVEAMACGVPIVQTDYTSTAEIVGYPFTEVNKEKIMIGEAGIGVPIATEIVGTWGVRRGFVNEDKFVEALNILYYDRNLLEKLGNQAMLKAKRDYDYDSVVLPMWESKIKSIMGDD